jgi:predicted nuclease of restriction endonuclease-like (RecB) superfamily
MTKNINTNFIENKEYKDFICEIKEGINRAKNTAILRVNTELVKLYYNIGKQIVEKQKKSKWGDGLIGQMEIDLKLAFPEMTGFSRRNLFYIKDLYILTRSNKNVPQLVAQIPWGHTRLIIDKTKDIKEIEFYIKKNYRKLLVKVYS